MTVRGPGAPGAWPAPPLRVVLESGLEVLLARHPEGEAVAVQLWLRAGARHERPEAGEAGLAHFVEHLLFKGTPSRGPGIIDLEVAAVGGEINAATSQDYTCYHVVLPTARAGTAIAILADAAATPTFAPEEIERERAVVLEEIRRAHDSPTASLWRALAGRHFGTHPYARPVLGTAESIAAASREAIVGFYRGGYAPGNATLVVAAPDPEALLEPVRLAFLPWEARPEALPRTDLLPTSPEPGRVEEERDLRQVHLGLAWGAPAFPSPDVHAADVLASILGHGRASRLHQGLRERLGLVSTIAAGYHGQHDGGTLAVTARTTAEHRHRAEAAVLEEVGRLARDLPSPEEMARALTVIEASYAFGHETAEGLAHALGAAVSVSSLEFELGYLEAVRRVTPEVVRETARRYLDPGRCTIAALGPLSGRQ